MKRRPRENRHDLRSVFRIETAHGMSSSWLVLDESLACSLEVAVTILRCEGAQSAKQLALMIWPDVPCPRDRSVRIAKLVRHDEAQATPRIRKLARGVYAAQ